MLLENPDKKSQNYPKQIICGLYNVIQTYPNDPVGPKHIEFKKFYFTGLDWVL